MKNKIKKVCDRLEIPMRMNSYEHHINTTIDSFLQEPELVQSGLFFKGLYNGSHRHCDMFEMFYDVLFCNLSAKQALEKQISDIVQQEIDNGYLPIEHLQFLLWGNNYLKSIQK